LHKLSPPWEGPFKVTKALLNGSYYLADIRDEEEKKMRKKAAGKRGTKRKRGIDDPFEQTRRPWNIEQLRPFYT